NYLENKGFLSPMDLIGKSLDRVQDWGDLNLNYKIIAKIDAQKCIGCNLCFIACEDGAHQCIEAKPRPAGDLRDGEIHKHMPRILEEECVGCNLCALVCPVPDCITMTRVDHGRSTMSWRELQAARGKNPSCSMEDLLAQHGAVGD